MRVHIRRVDGCVALFEIQGDNIIPIYSVRITRECNSHVANDIVRRFARLKYDVDCNPSTKQKV